MSNYVIVHQGAGFVAVPGAAALGVMGGTHIIKNTRNRARDIRTYNKGQAYVNNTRKLNPR